MNQTTRSFLVFILTLVACQNGTDQVSLAGKPGAAQLKVLLVDAVEMIQRYSYDSARMRLNEVDSLASLFENEFARSSVLANFGWLHQRLNNYDSAIYFFSQSIQIDESLNDTTAWLQHLKEMGWSYRSKGHFSGAVAHYEEAMSLAFSQSDSVNMASLANSLGNVLMELNDHEQAYLYFDLAAVTWRRMGRMSTYSIALQNKGSAMVNMDSTEKALPILYKALRLKDSLNRRASMAYTLSSLGSAFIKLKQLDSAERVFSVAYDIRDSLNDQAGLGEIILRQSMVFREREKFRLAEVGFKEVESIAKLLGKADLLKDAYEEKKALYKKWHRLGQLAEVDELYDIMTDSLYREEKLKVQEAQSAANLQREQQRTELAEQNTRLTQVELEATEQKGQLRLALAILASLGLAIIAWQLLQIRKRNTTLIALNDRIKLITDNAFHSQKNALGLISALLRSKARQAKHEQELAVLKDVEGKIEALGGVAKSLFQRRIEDNTAVAASVQLKAYLEELVDDTFSSVASEAELDMEVEDIETTSTEALNIGLITNEAVTNFSKYAETQGAETLVIRVLKQAEKLALTFIDDGPGFPEDFDFSTSTGFGMQMMANLVADMEGTIQLTREDDLTQIEIHIPLKS